MKTVYFPSVRGTFGDWVYYSSVLPIREVAKRVSYIKDVHKTKSLSKLIQRSITEKRKKEISDYLASNKERFFNSLVLAVYDNHPEWFPASVTSINETAIESLEGEVGLLKFSGKEKIIPIDGQHRLAGIKTLLSRFDKKEIEPSDEFSFINDIIPVIFVAHRKNTKSNLLRTRRLFTTLNKYAVKVNRYEIISLDEDDPMAITTRWLVENDKRFMNERIKIKGGANISPDDICLTSIENIYDILTILFSRVFQKVRKSTLTNGRRPPQINLKKYQEFATQYFDCLEDNYVQIKRYYYRENFGPYAIKTRKSGHLLFRPIGLKLVTNLLTKFEDLSLQRRFDKIADIPMNLYESPYKGLLISENGKMQDGNEVKARNIVLSALGIKLNKNERKSAIAGLSMIKGMPQKKLKYADIPKTLNEIKYIESI